MDYDIFVTIRFTKEAYDNLNKIALRDNISINDVVNKILEEKMYISKPIPINNAKRPVFNSIQIVG